MGVRRERRRHKAGLREYLGQRFGARKRQSAATEENMTGEECCSRGAGIGRDGEVIGESRPFCREPIEARARPQRGTEMADVVGPQSVENIDDHEPWWPRDRFGCRHLPAAVGEQMQILPSSGSPPPFCDEAYTNQTRDVEREIHLTGLSSARTS